MVLMGHCGGISFGLISYHVYIMVGMEVAQYHLHLPPPFPIAGLLWLLRLLPVQQGPG